MILFYDLPGWLLIAATILLLVRVTTSFFRTKSLIFFCYSFGALALMVSGTSSLSKFFIHPRYFELANQLTEWGRISAVSLLLCGLAALIREAKPPFARFPRIFCAFPLTIIPAHYFGMHTAVLKEWVVGIYEAGAIVIALVMYLSYLRRDYRFMYVVAGIVLVFFAFIAFWFRDAVLIRTETAWKVIFSAGLFFLSLGLSRTEQHFGSVAAASESYQE